MGEQTTLSVAKETLERFNELKATPEGQPEPSADQFLTTLLDMFESDAVEHIHEVGVPGVADTAIKGDVPENGGNGGGVDPAKIDEVRSVLDDLEDEVKSLGVLVDRAPDRTTEQVLNELEGLQ